MVSLASPWLPIVLPAMLVFIASSVIRMTYAVLTAGTFGWLWPR